MELRGQRIGIPIVLESLFTVSITMSGRSRGNLLGTCPGNLT
jgi:hypothetical protein